jgi:hypothetical protein
MLRGPNSFRVAPARPTRAAFPRPSQGDLLQVMPWPNIKDLTEHEMRAIYEYLKAVPCIQGNYPCIGGHSPTFRPNQPTAAPNSCRIATQPHTQLASPSPEAMLRRIPSAQGSALLHLRFGSCVLGEMSKSQVQDAAHPLSIRWIGIHRHRRRGFREGR